MAIFAVRSTQNVNEDSNQQANGGTTTHKTTSRPTASVPEPVIQFDDDMAHFVSHLDADPLAESQLKLHLVEYNPSYDGMVREIADDEDEYTFLSFQKLSYATVTALAPPSRTPTPTGTFAGDRPGSSGSGRKTSRQRDFSTSVLLDESDSECEWNVHKTRRGKSRAKGLAKKRGVKAV